MDEEALSDVIELHPILLIGAFLLCIATGSMLSQTLFAAISAYVGVSLLLASVIWLVLASMITVIGLSRSVL